MNSHLRPLPRRESCNAQTHSCTNTIRTRYPSHAANKVPTDHMTQGLCRRDVEDHAPVLLSCSREEWLGATIKEAANTIAWLRTLSAQAPLNPSGPALPLTNSRVGMPRRPHFASGTKRAQPSQGREASRQASACNVEPRRSVAQPVGFLPSRNKSYT